MTSPSVEHLLSGPALDAALHEIVEEAERVLVDVDSAGIAVHVAELPVRRASGRLAARVDEAQYRLRQGPCLQAFRADVLVVLDLDGADRRWPLFQIAARACGARTVLSVPLRLGGDAVGSLNLYSRQRGAFGARAVRQAALFARPAGLRLAGVGVAVHAAEAAEVAGLELQDRGTIERALGVLMAVHDDPSVEHARHRLEDASVSLGLDVPLTAARILTRPGEAR